jgi:hypothetical protein
MPHVVVRSTLRLTEIHRQNRLRALERLDLGLFVDGEDHGVGRGVMYSPTTSRIFSTSCGSGDSLNDSVRCGCSQNVRQMRPTMV